MKILFSSYHNPQFFTVTEYIENAILSSGHNLFCFDDRKYIFPRRLRQRLKWLHTLEIERLNRKFIDSALKNKPEIALIAGGHRISPGTIKFLKSENIICVLWTTDAPLVFRPIINVAPLYNYVFCQGTEAVEILKNHGNKNVYWLPVACDPKLHKRTPITEAEKIKCDKEIVFVGSYYPNRWKILKELNEFKLGIWGPGWHKIDEAKHLKSCIKDAHLDHNSWIKIYSAAKIVIVIHYQDGKIPCYQASPKIFEALACKSFVLVDKQKDVLKLFEDKKHLVSFSDIKDLKEKLNYYLTSTSEREKIAQQGYERAINKNTYEDRIQKMLKIIQNGN